LDTSLQEIFGVQPPERVRLEASEAVLRAPVAVWRLLYPGSSLHLTFVDSLRAIAQDYGIEAEPLRPSRPVDLAEVPPVSATVSATALLQVIFAEYARLMGAELALGRIAEVFDLTSTDLGRLFGISRQAVDQWRTRGVPAERRADIDRLRELVELYYQEFIPERIPQIVRRPVAALGGRTVLEALAEEGPAPVREYLARTFAFLAA
jgi:hypothetical protein